MNRGIAVAGNMIVDYNKMIPVFPERNGLVKISRVFSSIGGAVNNVAQDLARLDPSLPLKAVGLIGRDPEGEEILRILRQYPNVDLSRVLFEGRTSFTDVLAEEVSKLRTFLMYPGGNALFGIDHIDLDALNCDIFHIGYILLLDALDAPDAQYGTKMARLLHEIQKRGIQTSVDVVSETGDRFAKLVTPSLPYVDYLIINELEAGRTVGVELRDDKDALILDRIPDVLRALKRLGVKRWAAIHAPEGGFGIDEHGAFYAIAGFDLPEGFIAATVGAGDAFCAGALYAAYRGEDMRTAIEEGILTATGSLREGDASGGVEPLPALRVMAEGLKRRVI